MKVLIQHIYQRLNTLGYTVSLEKTPQINQLENLNIVVKFPNSIEDFQKEDFFLDVDLWHKTNDTTDLEDTTDAVNNLLHRYKFHVSNGLSIALYRINRLMIDDPDPDIRRRQIRFICKTYFE